MSEPAHVLEEAVRLFGALRRRLDGAPTQRPAADDVWGRATHIEPEHHIATGAAECQYCPICRAIAATRDSRPGLADQISQAGQSLADLLGEVLSFGDRSPTGDPEPTPTGFRAPRPPAGAGGAEPGADADTGEA